MPDKAVSGAFLVIWACALVLAGPIALACTTPVFQYALENWHSDFYRAAVFHRGPLSETDQAVLDKFEEEVLRKEPVPNLDLQAVDVSAIEDEELMKLYEASEPTRLPWMVVQYPLMTYNDSTVWSGPLEDAATRILVDSPVRREVARHLLEGQVGVWILLESGDTEADGAAARLLEEQLDKMEEVLEFEVGAVLRAGYWTAEEEGEVPEDAAEPEVPEAPPIQFSIIRVSRSDPAEQAFVEMLTKSEPDLDEYADKPMAFPIYGRGRILVALAGEGITEANVEAVCGFLVGPCMCTVGRPGTELLMAVDWDAALWGWAAVTEALPPLTGVFPTAVAEEESAEPLAAVATPEPASNEEGSAEPLAAVTTPQPVESEEESAGSLTRSVMILLGVAVAVVLAGTALLRRRTRASANA